MRTSNEFPGDSGNHTWRTTALAHFPSQPAKASLLVGDGRGGAVLSAHELLTETFEIIEIL